MGNFGVERRDRHRLGLERDRERRHRGRQERRLQAVLHAGGGCGADPPGYVTGGRTLGRELAHAQQHGRLLQRPERHHRHGADAPVQRRLLRRRRSGLAREGRLGGRSAGMGTYATTGYGHRALAGAHRPRSGPPGERGLPDRPAVDARQRAVGKFHALLPISANSMTIALHAHRAGALLAAPLPQRGSAAGDDVAVHPSSGTASSYFTLSARPGGRCAPARSSCAIAATTRHRACSTRSARSPRARSDRRTGFRGPPSRARRRWIALGAPPGRPRAARQADVPVSVRTPARRGGGDYLSGISVEAEGGARQTRGTGISRSRASSATRSGCS